MFIFKVTIKKKHILWIEKMQRGGAKGNISIQHGENRLDDQLQLIYKMVKHSVSLFIESV